MPVDTIIISDDEHDPQEILSQEMRVLNEDISKINETVGELGIEVTKYAKLLKAAQVRLEIARKQKEQLVNRKHTLLNKKQKLVQSAQISGGASSRFRPMVQEESAAELDSKVEALPRVGDFRLRASSPCSSHSHSIPKSPPPLLQSPPLSLSLGNGPTPMISDYDGLKPELEPESEPESELEPESEPEQPLRWSHQTSIAENIPPNSNRRRGRGHGSRRSYGGLNGVRLGASISGRGVAQLQRHRGVRTHVYGPYYEASDSESEASLGQNQSSMALATPQAPQNIPASPQTFSRKQISSIIGGKTQGTWCSINPNKVTVYNAGPYMALVRELNHLLPQQPGESGGVYVGDWLRKEVGKTYQVFIKISQNHWRYYGKYLVSSIREIPLAEWAAFQDADKNRWAEHLLEHRWGKGIIQKKNLMSEAECVKSNWRRVVSFFNRPDNLPKLRLKLLSLHFLSYDRGLYDAIASALPVPQKLSSVGKNRGKRPYSNDEEESSEY